MKIKSILFLFASLLTAAVLSSCGDRATGQSGDPAVKAALNAADIGERSDAFLEIQNDLLNSGTSKAAEAAIKAAGRPRSVEPGLIKEAIDFSSLGIEYFSVDPATVMQVSGTSADGESLQISDYGPAGELPVENRRPNIYVMFNKPMVPLAQLGSPITESSLLTIDPPVEGVYRWYGTKTLGFRPTSPLQDRPRYSVTISGEAKALDGEKLGEDFRFDIFGEKVKMVNLFPGTDPDIAVYLYDVPTKLARQLTLEFNQPVDPSHISRFITISDGQRFYEFTASRPTYPERLESRTERGVLLSLSEEAPENSSIEVSLLEGASPFPDFPLSIRPQSYRLRTIRPFESEGLSAYSGGFPRDNRPSLFPVYLHFSHPLDESIDTAKFRITVDGKKIVPADTAFSWSTIAFYLDGIKPGMRVEVSIPEGVRDVHGRESESSTETTEIPRPDPLVEFPYHYDGLRHLEAEFDPAVVWSSRNIVEGRFGIGGRSTFFDNPGYEPTMENLDLSAATKDVTYFHQEDLNPYLNASGRGTVFMNYNVRRDPSQVRANRQWTDGGVAVQVTDLGLTVRAGYNKVLVWVNRLSDGRSVAGAEVTVFNLYGVEYKGRSDKDGLAVIDIPAGDFARFFYNRSNTRGDSIHVRAEFDGDLAELRVYDSHSPYAFGVYNTASPERVEASVHRIHMFTDRGLYKGGEELALRGIHWIQDPEGFSSYRGGYTAEIIESATGEIIWSESGKTSSSGGYSLRLKLPEDLEPGAFTVRYRGNGFESVVGFRIASFRRVSFQVNSVAERRDYYHGDSVEVSVKAESLSGGVLPSAPYHYYWSRKPIRYVPPGPEWGDWTFGTSAWAGEQSLSSGDGTLSSSGTARISEGSVAHEVTGKAYRYTLETTVEDIDRQVVSSTASAVVHPASYYVGARFVQGAVDGWWSRFVSVGENIEAAARLVDPAGGIFSGAGTISAGLIKGEWKSVQQQGLYGRINTRWEYVEEELWTEEIALDDGEGRVEFVPETPGSYTLYFEHHDEADRVSRTEIEFYATGSGWVNTASRTPQDINLIVDKELYEPGETARILVQSPVPEGRYLLTIEREGILDERIIALAGSSELIEIPIDSDYVPVVYVALSSFTERTVTEDDYFEPDLGKPRDLFGISTLRIATTPMELDVKVVAGQENYQPGDEAEIIVTVEKDGRPIAGAEVTVLAVDRGVLDLIDYHVPNPLDYFYDEYHFPLGTIGDDSRRLLLRPVTYEVSDLQGGDGEKLEERKDFNPLALFEPAVITDSNGEVRLNVNLPDTLTSYRMTALALEGTRLGLDENEFKVSNPVNVRSALPRRFRNRDAAAAGVILTNTTEREIVLEVKAESDILTVAGETTKEVSLPGLTSLELPFLFEARRKGEGEIRFTVRSDLLNEILIEPIQVEQPIVKEAFTTVGIIDDSQEVTETVLIPQRSAEGYGGLSISADSSLLPYIEESIERLIEIPYPSLNEGLYRLSAEAVSGGKLHGLEGLLGELAARQFQSGGIGYHSEATDYSRPSWFLSVLSAHVTEELLGRAYTFDNPIDTQALDAYLLERLDKARSDENPGLLSAWTARVLALRGVIGPGELSWLFEAEDQLGIAGYNLLSQAYSILGLRREAKSLYDRGKNFVTMGTQSISIAETYEASDYFSNGELELALFLATASSRNEEPELLMRIAGALDQNRHSRRFRSSFDDFWMIFGFSDLITRESEGRSSEFRASLADQPLTVSRGDSQGHIKVREGYPFAIAPLSNMPKNEALELRLQREGSGDIYYAATLRYALPVEAALPRDEGIEVTSTIETLDGEVLDVEALPLGETLRVRVNIGTLVRRSFLKLDVPIPSGAEVLDASFSTTGSYGDAGGVNEESWTRETVYGDSAEVVGDGYAYGGPGGWFYWFYRPVQRIYDNAVSYSWEDFYPGQREVSFLIRTTTPGIYPTPPVSAVCEFEPEVFGRSPGRLAVIQGK